jgi:carnitine 3-dehydrogenase
VRTSQAAVDAAMGFYAACGKHPILLTKEVRGHIANRLQAALWQEAFHLVAAGIATVADIDAAIAHGPGLRWALLGPFLNLHLSGGSGGMTHYLAHLGPAIEAIWLDLGKVALTPECKTAVIAGVRQQLAGRDLPATIQDRDRLLIELLRAKAVSSLP